MLGAPPTNIPHGDPERSKPSEEIGNTTGFAQGGMNGSK